MEQLARPESLPVFPLLTLDLREQGSLVSRQLIGLVGQIRGALVGDHGSPGPGLAVSERKIGHPISVSQVAGSSLSKKPHR